MSVVSVSGRVGSVDTADADEEEGEPGVNFSLNDLVDFVDNSSVWFRECFLSSTWDIPSSSPSLYSQQ